MWAKKSRVVAAVLAIAVAAVVAGVSSSGDRRVVHRVNARAIPATIMQEKLGNGGERDRSLAEEQYEDRALPNDYVAFVQQQGAQKAFKAIQNGSAPSKSWQELGPKTPTVPALVTYTGKATTDSGRVTALAVAPTCVPGSCRLVVGAAGGGVWRTSDALASSPAWTPAKGLDSDAIGSLAIDPTNANVVYAGTGEPNGSGDSEAGIGLYKSTDGGSTFSLVAGSVAVSKSTSIGAIAIDPTNSSHLYIGTDVARHGSSSANGGRRTPPDAAPYALYESKDGGATWSVALQLPPSPNPPSSGVNWFQGGVNDIEFDPSNPQTVYAAVFGYGAWKRAAGASSFTQMFQTMNPSDTFGDRTELAVTTKNGKTRIYLADSSDDLGRSDLWRSDDAGATFTKLSSPVNGTPGFASYNFCGGQCGYDMPIATPPGKPDAIWIGGQMQYDELPGGLMRSNGRAIQRSTDAGVSFTDMTDDGASPPVGMHPDQHAIAFASSNPDIAFVGSDGGVIRTSGSFVDRSSSCNSRGLSGADLTDCKSWLSAVPSTLTSLNDGLATIQFQSLSLNPKKADDLQGGTQDNGTWWNNGTSSWFESVGGDGGQSGIGLDGIRVHTYYDASPDINYTGDIADWNWIGDPLYYSNEQRSFYIPLIGDPSVAGTWFAGLASVWRTQDNGGDRAYIQKHCNEYTGDFQNLRGCGDWVPLGGGDSDLTSKQYGADKGGNYVVATERSPSDAGTLWAGTRVGRVLVSKNADAAATQVKWTRVDTSAQPRRFVSSIYVDPKNGNHAWVSFSGYQAYTPTQPGHVFDVVFNPATGKATWTDLSYNLGDQPITDLVRDDVTGTLYAATDFGVLGLTTGSTRWQTAANGLPPVAVYGLTISSANRALYAATHGRGAWKLSLP